MYTSFQLATKYLRYYLSASNSKGHGIHSPFVFNFILDVLNNRQNYTPPSTIEALRNELKVKKELLLIEDLGAGSRTSNTRYRSVAQLAKTAVKATKYSQLLYRLAKHYQPKTMVELGTSLGLTTAYLAQAASTAEIITIEGSKAIQEVALSNFQKLNVPNIQPVHGPFDAVLPVVLAKLPTVDLGYIDGNHRYEPTIHYFNQFLTKKNNQTILVFDDIHWSSEMEKAWTEIQQHPSVRCTIDIFFLGFVFFRAEFKEQQHFRIRF